MPDISGETGSDIASRVTEGGGGLSSLTGVPGVDPEAQKSLTDVVGALQNFQPDRSARWLQFAADVTKPQKFAGLGSIISSVAEGQAPLAQKEADLKNQYSMLAKQMAYQYQIKDKMANQAAQMGLQESGLKLTMAQQQMALAQMGLPIAKQIMSELQGSGGAPAPLTPSGATTSFPNSANPDGTGIGPTVTSQVPTPQSAVASSPTLQKILTLPPQEQIMKWAALKGTGVPFLAALADANLKVLETPQFEMTRQGTTLNKFTGKTFNDTNVPAAIASGEAAKQGEEIKVIKTPSGAEVPYRMKDALSLLGTGNFVPPPSTPVAPGITAVTPPGTPGPTRLNLQNMNPSLIAKAPAADQAAINAALPAATGQVSISAPAPTTLFPNVTPQTGIGQTTAQADTEKAAAEEASKVRDAASNAAGIKYSLAQMRNALQGFDTGKFSSFKQGIKETFQGIAPGMVDPKELDNIASYQDFQKYAQKLGFGDARTMGAREAVQVIEMSLKSNPNTGLVGPAVNSLINGRQAIADYDIAKAKAQDDYMKQSGGTLGGFNTAWNNAVPNPAAFLVKYQSQPEVERMIKSMPPADRAALNKSLANLKAAGYLQ